MIQIEYQHHYHNGVQSQQLNRLM